jgi:hypothetical protein
VIISPAFAGAAAAVGAFVPALLSPLADVVLLQPSKHRLAAATTENRRIIIIFVGCHESQRAASFGEASFQVKPRLQM